MIADRSHVEAPKRKKDGDDDEPEMATGGSLAKKFKEKRKK